MIEKRGASHIEIILAFILFAGFIVFALYFFSPRDTDRFVETNIDYVNREVMKYANSDVDEISVKIDSSKVGFGKTRVILSGVAKIDGEDIDLAKNVGTVDSNGEVLASNRRKNNEDDICVVWQSKEIMTLRFSNGIDNDGSNYCQGAQAITDNNGYEVVFVKNRMILSENGMLALKDEYYNNYLSLKKDEFNLPDRVNFAVNLTFGDSDEIVMEQAIPDNLEVFVNTRRVEVLRGEGNIVFADLVIKVW